MWSGPACKPQTTYQNQILLDAIFNRLQAPPDNNRQISLDVRGSVHHSTILTVKNPTIRNSVSKFLLFLILNEAQHVLGDTPPIIRSLKLHKQPPVLHMWKVVGRCPTTFHICKTRGCLCSFRLLMMGGVSPKTCWVSFKIRNNKNFDTLLHLVRFFTARQISIQIYHYFLPELIIFVPDVIGTNPLLAIALRYNASQHTENLRHKNILFLN